MCDPQVQMHGSRPKAGHRTSHARALAEQKRQRIIRQSPVYKEQHIWAPFRLLGLTASFTAFSLTIFTICSRTWLVTPDFHLGIWNGCFTNQSREPDGFPEYICVGTNKYWQNAVIGLLIFSVAFGFLGTILSICGLCTSTLSRKIYYYHSAGEIYFICALSSMAALVVYPVSVELEKEMVNHKYGVGYCLGWGGALFYLLASFSMCLDDIVRAIARGLCGACYDRGGAGSARTV